MSTPRLSVRSASARRWIAAARRGAAVAGVTCAGVFAWNRLVVPAFPDDRVGSHHTEVAVFQDVPTLRGPVYRYGEDAGSGLLIAGDSRVQAGIVAREFERAGLGPVCVLSGPSAQLFDLLQVAGGMQPRHLVICLSPLSVHWEMHAGMVAELEQGRDRWATAQIDSRLNEWVSVSRRRLTEPLYPRVWDEGWFGGLDPRGSTTMYRRMLRPRSHGRRLAELRKIWDRLKEMQAQGWDLECIRLPISAQLRGVEDKCFEPSLFVGMCKNLGVPYTDFQDLAIPTADGSHVVAGRAPAMSRRIARRLQGGARSSADPH